MQEVEGGEQYIVRSPEDGSNIAAKFIGDDDREVFFVMCLNMKNRVVAVHRCHVGSLNASIVIPREVFKAAILNNSASIIVSHQHPSNDCIGDIRITLAVVFFVKPIKTEMDTANNNSLHT